MKGPLDMIYGLQIATSQITRVLTAALNHHQGVPGSYIGTLSEPVILLAWHFPSHELDIRKAGTNARRYRIWSTPTRGLLLATLRRL